MGLLATASIVLPAAPARADSFATCKFGIGQVFDTQWSYNASSQQLNVSGLTVPYHEAGGQIQGLQAGDYFQFTDNGGSFGLRLYNSGGGFKEVVTNTGSFIAAGPGFVFYNQLPNGNGTLFTTQNSYRYGDSAVLQASVSNPDYSYMKNQFGSCSGAPIAGGATSTGTAGSGNPPSVTPSVSPSPNGYGWNNSDVGLNWNVTSDSGLTGSSGCNATTVTLNTAGANFTCSATNGAGTTTRSQTIRLDRTPPSISGAPTTTPNSAGWYRNDVAVHWSCADGLSGLVSCPADSTVGGEGASRSVSSSAQDYAGNTGTASVSGINIDRTAPITTASAPSTWQNHDVTVTLSASDALSGVESTYYSLDGGSPQAGNSVLVAGDGNHTLSWWSLDRAGNTESARQATILVDQTAPSISHALAPSANAAGWNNGPVTVTFVCADPQSNGSASGVASCSAPAHFANEGAGQTATGNATDVAGNSNSDTATVNIDLTQPAITAQVPAPGPYGWYTAATPVNFSCTDALSGVASCEPTHTLDDGANQSVTGAVTDAAGNSASAVASGLNVDATAPTIIGTTNVEPNAAGWFHQPVSVSFACADATSGVSGCPAPVTLSGDARNASATGAATDKAGNSASTTVGGLNIDLSGPSITGAATSQPGDSGWYGGPVTVHFTCSDAFAGIASCPDDVILSNDGENQSVTGTAVDAAGNTASYTVSGINIDTSAPITLADSPSAWSNHQVTVTLNAADAMSGVAHTYSKVDDGPATEGTTVEIDGDGLHELVYWSVDNNGNVEEPNSVTVKVDESAPTITHATEPLANDAGWNNSAVTVSFECADPSVNGAASGVASCSDPSTLTDEGARQEVFGSAADVAGNTNTDTATINIDLTAPSIAGSVPAPNDAGWYTEPTTVSFACDDALSGVAACEPTRTLVEGADQSVTGNVADAAGNTASSTVSGINIDLSAPTISGAATTAPNADGWYTGPVTVHFTCDDALSGVATCPDDVEISGDGADHSVTGTAIDVAGNIGSVTVTGINIDTVDPTITAAPTTQPNAAGWYSDKVTVHFTCADTMSGVASCPADVVLDADGTNQSASGTVVDKAGHTASAAVTGINIDRTAATSVFDTPDRAVLANIQVSGRATDTLSGVARVLVTYTPTTPGASAYSTQATLNCDALRTMCAWKAPLPTTPGQYKVTSQATDTGGAVERNGPTITVVSARTGGAPPVGANI